MPRRLISTVVALTVMSLLALGLAPSPSTAHPAPLGHARVAADPFASGDAAIGRLGDRLPSVAAANRLAAGELRRMLRNDSTLAVDANDELAYFDRLAPGEVVGDSASSAAIAPVAAPPTSGPEFQLSSNPGAAKTIYLDFDGHVTTGTSWNQAYGVSTIVSPPYDTDGNPDGWSSGELGVIRNTWAVVAEDFAPWDLNVTTIDPGPEALRRSGSGDTEWGARVVITDDTFANCSCGGHAYIGAFDDNVDEPTFVYNSSFTGVSEASTHEVGHMLNLAHDGTADATYYTGHDGPGDTGWAPIMGAAYYQPVSQWSRQEYTGANNDGSSANYGNGPDDLAIISSLSNGNGFGLRLDDHGDALGSATLISSSPVTEAGIIGTGTDVDAFSFNTGGGQLDLVAVPAAIGPNLDIELVLRGGAGQVVATSNPAAGLDAGISLVLPAGTYSIEVDGTGTGAPGATPPSGYGDYASIGQYTLSGSIAGLGPADTTPPAPPTALTATVVATTIELDWADNGEDDLSGYVVRRATVATGPYVDISNVAASGAIDENAPSGISYYVVVARDLSGNLSAPSEVVSAELPPTPQVASGQLAVSGTVSGSVGATHERGGSVQTITEVASGGKPTNRHDLAEHRWAIPAADGNQTLTVVAEALDGGDADDGFSVQWSADGATWIPLATVPAGGRLDQTFEIGGPTGTVWVRMVDTDRSAGERGFDSVAVDHLSISGDGLPVTPGTPTTALATLSTSTQSAGRGLQHGVATVRVTDEFGSPISGASVSVTFSGSFEETVAATTDANGTATARTGDAIRKPSFSVCVATLDAAGLVYAAGPEGC